MNDKKKNSNGSSGLVLGMCIGLAIGTAVGAATDNIGLWMPVGLCLGRALGLALGHKKKEDSEDGTDDTKQP